MSGATLLARALLEGSEPRGEQVAFAPHEVNSHEVVRSEAANSEVGSPEATLPQPEPTKHTRAVSPAPIENGIVMTHGKVRLVMLSPEPTLAELEEVQDLENSK